MEAICCMSLLLTAFSWPRKKPKEFPELRGDLGMEKIERAIKRLYNEATLSLSHNAA